MTNLLFVLLSTHAQAATSELSTGTSAKAEDKSSWTVSEQDCPEDEVYSKSDVGGTLGLMLTELDTTELWTGSASAQSDVEDSGSSDHFVWAKQAVSVHESSWRFRDHGERGVLWSYVGVSDHEAETILEGQDCEPDDWDISCMVEITAAGSSGMTSAGDESEPGEAGDTGGMGTSDSDEDDTLRGPTRIIVKERTTFQLVVTFSANVDVAVSGDGEGGHASHFGIALTEQDTGAAIVARSGDPMIFQWSFQTTENDTIRDSERQYFTLEAGEYTLTMGVGDVTWSSAVSDPMVLQSTSSVTSTVRASVLLAPL